MRVIAGIALRNLIQARRRTLLLSTAIGLVTTLLVVLLSISSGIEDNLVSSATTLGGGHVVVAGFYKQTPTASGAIVTNKAEMRRLIEENTPNLDYVIDRHRGWGKVVSDTKSIQSALSGIDISQEQRLVDRLVMAKESEYYTGGRDEVFGSLEDLGKGGQVVLFTNQAKRLQVRVGDAVTFQVEMSGGQTNTRDLTVAAVARDIGMLSSWSMFLSQEDVQQLYSLNEDTTGALWVYLDDIDEATATMGHLRQVFEDAGYRVMDHQPAPFFFKFDGVAGEDWVGQKLDLTIWKDEVSFLLWAITAFNTVTWFLIVVLVAIIAVGIMNALWNSVRERTREIGTMRAIGMTRSSVLALILFEALFLGLFATSAGAALGVGIAWAVDAAEIAVPVQAMEMILLSDTLHLAVDPAQLLQAVSLLTLFTVFSAIWPAARAARMPPVTAIHQVE